MSPQKTIRGFISTKKNCTCVFSPVYVSRVRREQQKTSRVKRTTVFYSYFHRERGFTVCSAGSGCTIISTPLSNLAMRQLCFRSGVSIMRLFRVMLVNTTRNIATVEEKGQKRQQLLDLYLVETNKGMDIAIRGFLKSQMLCL